MNSKQYLERINYVDSLNTSFEVLSKLQVMHLMNVPFENLDIHNHIKIDLKNLYNKIVVRKRGGFCYELNGLFYELLKEIGFTVKIVSAKVYSSQKSYSPEFDHMALVATVKNDKYLVDVGFGEFTFYPVKIKLNKESIDPAGVFRIEPYNEDYIIIEKKNAEGEFISNICSQKKKGNRKNFMTGVTFTKQAMNLISCKKEFVRYLQRPEE